MSPQPEATTTRPRVEGDREAEILEATLEVLAEVGYDRLTMDAVAARAKASKATLYRRWNDKASLVVDALLVVKHTAETPDTGTLRGDLIASFCGLGGLTDEQGVATFASVLTAIHGLPARRTRPQDRLVEPHLRARPRPRGAPCRRGPRSARPGTRGNHPAPPLCSR